MNPERLLSEPIFALGYGPGAPGRSSILFAGCASGLYRSADAGATWIDSFARLRLAAPLPAVAVAVSPQFAQDQTLFVGVPGGALRSTDAGESWRVLPFRAPPPNVTSLVVSPDYADDGIVIAGSAEDGILRTEDKGDRWSPWNFGLIELEVLCLAGAPAFSKDRTVLAGTATGCFRSRNGGKSWQELHLPPGHVAVISAAVARGPAGELVLYAGTEEHGLYRTYDGGISWTRIGADSLGDPINAILLGDATPNGHDVLVLHGEELLLSTDGGAHWAELDVAAGGKGSISAVLAPLGLGAGRPLVLGRNDGCVINHYLE